MSSRFMAPQAGLSVGLAFRQASSAQERAQVCKKPGDGPQHPVTSPELAGELTRQEAGARGEDTTERTDHEDIDPKPRRSRQEGDQISKSSKGKRFQPVRVAAVLRRNSPFLGA